MKNQSIYGKTPILTGTSAENHIKDVNRSNGSKYIKPSYSALGLSYNTDKHQAPMVWRELKNNHITNRKHD